MQLLSVNWAILVITLLQYTLCALPSSQKWLLIYIQWLSEAFIITMVIAHLSIPSYSIDKDK